LLANSKTAGKASANTKIERWRLDRRGFKLRVIHWKWLNRVGNSRYTNVSKFGNQWNAVLARLILHRGVVGKATQMACHVVAFVVGREHRRLAWAGIRRAVWL
jgi:hypothetical protein